MEPHTSELYLVQLLYSPDQIRVAWRILKKDIICNKKHGISFLGGLPINSKTKNDQISWYLRGERLQENVVMQTTTHFLSNSGDMLNHNNKLQNWIFMQKLLLNAKSHRDHNSMLRSKWLYLTCSNSTTKPLSPISFIIWNGCTKKDKLINVFVFLHVKHVTI